MVSRTKFIIICVLAALVLVGIITALVVVLDKDEDKSNDANKGDFKAGAVASDSTLCNHVGKRILKDQGGNAVDSAVATVFCLGVVNLMSLGIGGGGFMVIHDAQKKIMKVYDYREEAPAGSSENMFVDQKNMTKYGGLAAGVPGQVRGLKLAHHNHGILQWNQLFNETILLAERGFKIHPALAYAISTLEKEPYVSEGLKTLLFKDGKWLKEGDLLINKELAKTMRIIRDNPDDFYVGDLAKQIVKDINAEGGNMTHQDLANYKVKVRDTLNMTLPNGLTIHAAPTPAGGAPLAMIHNIMSGYNLKENQFKTADDKLKFYQPYIESMKFAFAQRGLLGDPAFLPEGSITKVEKRCTNLTIGDLIRQNKIKMNETHFNVSYYGGAWGENDYGTSHTSVFSSDGSAVSTTKTVNLYFGGKVRSNKTGIIFNNQMDDFSTPNVTNAYGLKPTKANFIKPGKRPQSSACPTIIVDKNGAVKLIVGASGGSRIISAVSEVIAKKLYLKDITLQDSIRSFRFHNQGQPNTTSYLKKSDYEPDTTTDYTIPGQELIYKLTHIGHLVKEVSSLAVTQGIYVDAEDHIFAMSDARKGAVADGFNAIVYNSTHEIKV
eukprot:TCONS_00029500-protein